MRYKFLEHTADVKFRAFGKTLEEAFSNSALALVETMTRNIKIKPRIKKNISVSGSDLENLLYNFLEEFLFLFDSERFVFAKIEKIEIKDNKLEAEILGDNADNYNISNDVKAVTYNSMFVKIETGKVTIQVVLDV